MPIHTHPHEFCIIEIAWKALHSTHAHILIMIQLKCNALVSLPSSEKQKQPKEHHLGGLGLENYHMGCQQEALRT